MCKIIFEKAEQNPLEEVSAILFCVNMHYDAMMSMPNGLIFSRLVS